MANPSLAAVGSGLDIPTLVKQLVAAERRPTEQRINKQGTATTAKLSALGTLKSALGNVQSTLKDLVKSVTTPAYKTTVPEGSGFTASLITEAGTGKTAAAAGSYNVEVVRLAQTQKLTSSAFTADASPGDGKLSFSWGTHTLDVDIAKGSTLKDIASAINKAAGGKGVNATVVTASDGQHLVFNAVSAGTDGALKVSASGGNGGLSAFAWNGTSGGMQQNTAAANALVRVDGFERESSSNTITDIIPGISLNLTKAEAGAQRTLGIAQDTSSLKINMQAFVSAYNATVKQLSSVSAYDATSNKASALTGDALVRGLQQQLRSQFSANVSEMKALGLTIAKDGSLAFSGTTFDKALTDNPDAVADLIGEHGSLTTGMEKLLKSNLDTHGTLTQRTDSLNKQVKRLEKELGDLDARMQKVSQRYTRQFITMDTLVANMQSTSNFLAMQLGVSLKS